MSKAETIRPRRIAGSAEDRAGRPARGGARPASTRRPPSPRWSPISAPRCRRRRSTSMTTIPPTAPSRSRAPPARVVRREMHQGKGNVVRRMFADVDADIYVLVDGDATYDAPSARAMIARLIEDRLDMVVAARVDQEQAAYRLGHRTGNRLLTGFFASVFEATFTDILSGYRVFSRRFVKSFPVLSRGFEIETELAVHALELELPVAEIATPYYARPAGLGVEAQHLARRLAHPLHHRQALPLGAAARVLHRARRRARDRFRRPRRFRSSSPISSRASFRAFRRRSCRPA